MPRARPARPARARSPAARRRSPERSGIGILGQFLQTGSDQRIDFGALAEPPRRHGNRAERLGPAIAKIDQRRNRVSRQTVLKRRAARRGRRHLRDDREPADLVAQFVDDASGEFRPDTLGTRQHRLVLSEDRQVQPLRRHRRQDRQGQPSADALHGCQQPKPVALGSIDKAVEMDMVLADMGLDQQARRGAGQQLAQGASRAEGKIADAADINDRAVRGDRVENAAKLGDHRASLHRCTVPAWWAWQIATASASAASGSAMAHPGNRRRTIICTCPFSAWPAPTTDFLTMFAEYSATGSPRSAGAKRTTPRATPSFRVETGFLLTKVSSTAASSGWKRSMISVICRNRATSR